MLSKTHLPHNIALTIEEKSNLFEATTPFLLRIVSHLLKMMNITLGDQVLKEINSLSDMATSNNNKNNNNVNKRQEREGGGQPQRQCKEYRCESARRGKTDNFVRHLERRQ
jgi:hypothetical protein